MRTAQLWPKAILGYVAAALAFTWPLARQLSTALPGSVTGDTGVYVWNLWLFRHEILVHHRLPYFTSEILSLTPPVDLSLHNYTVFDDLLAFPLIPLFGPVAAYNIVYLAAIVLSACMMFALAKRQCGSAAAAWLAGLLFAWSPTLVARGEAHLSLVTAAALPAFVLAFQRWWRRGRFVDAVVAGLTVAWAVMSDPYYGVYCAMLAVVFAVASCVRISRAGLRPAPPRLVHTVDAMAAASAALVVAILATGGFGLTVFGVHVRAYTLYTPILALTALAAVRALLLFRPQATFSAGISDRQAAIGAAGAAVGCVPPLLPFFFALAARLSDGGRFHAPTMWRSSPPGVDLLALVAPNPNSPLFGGWLRPWLDSLPGGFVENVASLTFVGAAIVIIAIWRFRYRPPTVWLAVTGGSALISLGPFVHIAGRNTYVPGPWALLRYVPLIASARMPARFAAPMMMGVGVLFAGGLAQIGRERSRWRRMLFSAVAMGLVFELAPSPLALYDASVPDIYATIAHDPRTIRVLELPLGFRDGESSYGNFTAASQFYQTFHQKRLIGGYLSRISTRELARQFRFPVVRALVAMSEGRELSPEERRRLLLRARRFAARARIGYVVVDRARTPEPLLRAAIDAFGLTRIGADRGRELYRVPATIGELALSSPRPDLNPPIPPIAAIDQ